MMNRLIEGRTPFFLIFLACAGLLGYAYYAQFVMGLEPCPLCILQRFGFMIMGVAALAAAIHGPKSWGRWVYGATRAAAPGPASQAVKRGRVWEPGLIDASGPDRRA